MIKNSYNIPKFLSNSILRSVDLNALNQNIQTASSLSFEEFEQGIILGLNAYVDENRIYVSKGIYKLNDEIHFLDDQISIDIPEIEGEYILTLKCDLKDEDYVIKKEYSLKYGTDEKGIQIAKFHIRNGAVLENQDYELKKFEKEYNVLDSFDSTYSKTGINPKILKIWANKMLEKKIQIYDILIAYLCKLEMINLEILQDYISKKLKIKLENTNNREIIKCLYQILENVDQNLSLDSLEENIKNISFQV